VYFIRIGGFAVCSVRLYREAGARYIVGAGCEVTRDTAPDNVRALAEYARGHK
jgi:uroporphyrinogen-III decarboxylase